MAPQVRGAGEAARAVGPTRARLEAELDRARGNAGRPDHGSEERPQQESLLLTLEEISKLVSHSGNPTETLTNIVRLIQERFVIDVCSVYLLEPDRATLVLAATVGLRPESVGRVRMRLSEGLAGLVAETVAPQLVEDATQLPGSG